MSANTIKFKPIRPVLYRKLRPFRIIKQPKVKEKILSRLIPKSAKTKTFKVKPPRI